MVRLTDRLIMTIAVDWDVKPEAKQPKTNLLTISITDIKSGFSLFKEPQHMFQKWLINKTFILINALTCIFMLGSDNNIFYISLVLIIRDFNVVTTPKQLWPIPCHM